MVNRTTGPTIGFRLPLELHDLLVMRAQRHGETPGQYVRRGVLAALALDLPLPSEPAPNPLPERVHDPTCICPVCRPAKAPKG